MDERFSAMEADVVGRVRLRLLRMVIIMKVMIMIVMMMMTMRIVIMKVSLTPWDNLISRKLTWASC